MKNTNIRVVTLLLCTVLALPAMAEVPALLPVQGVLADASDQPVDDLTDMTFTIYPSEFGGIAVWSEVYDGANQVDVEEGFFTVYLGQITPLDFSALTDESELWLGMTVGTDSEMDRIQLATVPFAMEAQRCEKLGEITETDISGAPFYGISSNQVSNWDAAYGWGDHGAAGYVTTEADPLFITSPASGITGTQVADWDTAFAWGDHDGLYSPADHKHDDRYYTETELQTSGSAQVNWNNLVNVPAGFVDGIDDSTDMGIDYAGASHESNLPNSPTIVRSISMVLPQNGYVHLNASGYVVFEGSGEDIIRCSLGTSTSIDFAKLTLNGDHGNTDTFEVYGPVAISRTLSANAGTRTYRLVCDCPRGTCSIGDFYLSGLFVQNRY